MSLIPDILDSQRVLYQCSCQQFKTIHHIYFCRYCNEIRCQDCVSHEVDSQFCPQCLEYIPSLDAKLKKNKCAQCYQCPCCHNTLSTRIQLTPVQNQTDSQPTIKKFSYYYCYFCRWTSRDIGVPDQTISGSTLPEPEVPESKRLESLFEYYRILSHKEKNEKEKKRVNPRNAIFLLDKYGITSALSAKVTATLRARMARSSSGISLSDIKSFPELEDFKPATPLSGEELEKMERLNIEEFYPSSDQQQPDDTVIDVVDMCSLHQTLNQVERQPRKCKDLYPNSQMLVVKRSLRCKKCEHNLSKPEYNPSLIKFKIQLSAYYHVPELRILRTPKSLKSNETSRIEMTLTNPTQYLINVTLLPLDLEANPIADVVLPNTVLQLTPKDDTGDIVDFDSSNSKFNDDPNVISFRQGNKLGVYLFVTPKKDSKINDQQCKIKFRMKHDYVYTTIPTTLNPMDGGGGGGGDKLQPTKETKWICHTIQVNLGDIQHASTIKIEI